MAQLQEQDQAIKGIEKRIATTKATLKTKTAELELKLQLKRFGGDRFKRENETLIQQVDADIAALNPANKADKRKITALNKDRATLEERIAQTDALLAAIGGQLTEDEARRLILKKLYDIIRAEQERYLNAEKRSLVQGVEKLWDKYAVSSRTLEAQRQATLRELDGFLGKLGYV
jgi:type I restriction enzyme M protein